MCVRVIVIGERRTNGRFCVALTRALFLVFLLAEKRVALQSPDLGSNLCFPPASRRGKLTCVPLRKVMLAETNKKQLKKQLFASAF